MNASATKGFFVGCVTSVLALVLFVFLFVLMCGLLMRGCVEAADLDEAQDGVASLRRKIERPEDDANFARTWVCGAGGVIAPKVLRIRLHGVLMDHESRSLFDLDDIVSAPAALRHLEAAVKDKSLRGLWLDIDSPGGSVTMSDRLHDAVLRFKAANTNRFVFVQMGDMCCSGGYYVSAAADRIMARPTTLTGSIGVIMSGVNAAGLAQKLGIESVSIASATNKDLLNPLKPVDPAHVEILKKPIVQMYERFVGIVAKGRHLPVAKVREIADGRVLSAEDARKSGLVDLIGHDREAMAEVCRLARAKAVRVYRYREKPNLEKLFSSSFLFERAGDFVRGVKGAVEESATPTLEYR